MLEFRILLLLFLLVSNFTRSNAFSSTSRSRFPSTVTSRSRRASFSSVTTLQTTLSSSDQSTSSYSNFWYAVTSKDKSPNDSDQKLPCVPNLDKEGTLPSGAYFTHGTAEYAPKQTCRITVGIDWEPRKSNDDVDTDVILRNLQSYIDSGFTSFALKSDPNRKNRLGGPSDRQIWAEESIYAKLLQQTPASVTAGCKLVVPYWIPPQTATNVNSSTIRKTVLESLTRIGGDAIDELALEYCRNSPYHLDVLDVMQELQRQGYVRSVSASNFPTQTLREAKSEGFSVDLQQIEGNLLDPSSYSLDRTIAAKDLGTPLVVASPLAGGLLTARHVNKPFEPLNFQLTPSERRALKYTLPLWYQRREKGKENSAIMYWHHYQTELLPTLQDMAFQHSVSIASICLRWLLQLEDVNSTLVGCRMIDAGDERPGKPRPHELRQVFTFELSDDDMAKLWELSGWRPPSRINTKDSNDDEWMQGVEPDGSGLILPKSKQKQRSNPSLWI